MKKGRLFLNVARLMENRGLTHLETWLTRHGFSRKEARTLLQEDHRLCEQMQRLCELFDCTPDDIMDWDGPDNSPLRVLRKEPARRVERIFRGKSQAWVDQALLDLERRAKEED
jgi:hypothetical protein